MPHRRECELRTRRGGPSAIRVHNLERSLLVAYTVTGSALRQSTRSIRLRGFAFSRRESRISSTRAVLRRNPRLTLYTNWIRFNDRVVQVQMHSVHRPRSTGRLTHRAGTAAVTNHPPGQTTTEPRTRRNWSSAHPTDRRSAQVSMPGRRRDQELPDPASARRPHLR